MEGKVIRMLGIAVQHVPFKLEVSQRNGTPRQQRQQRKKIGQYWPSAKNHIPPLLHRETSKKYKAAVTMVLLVAARDSISSSTGRLRGAGEVRLLSTEHQQNLALNRLVYCAAHMQILSSS